MFASKLAFFIYGCFAGGIIGFIGCAICAASGMASRCEECRGINQKAKTESE